MIKSFCLCASGDDSFRTECVRRNVDGATVLAFSRTIRGLPDLEDAGEAVRSLRLALKDNGLLRLAGRRFSCSDPSLCACSFCDGEDPSTTDASSPSNAFASALNFMGGTGISSSELSPMENFHDCGSGGPLFAEWARGAPRRRLGLDENLFAFWRDIDPRAGSPWLAAKGVGDAAAIAALKSSLMHSGRRLVWSQRQE